MRPLSILLVEDNPDHAELMLDTLEQFCEGQMLDHVSNGEEALRYLDEAILGNTPSVLPDLILLDLKMPVMNGRETLSNLKSHNDFKNIPVIIVSTSCSDLEIKECFDLGANSYISKPVSYVEFSSKISAMNHYWNSISELPVRG